jgi:hypothetical protein
MKTPQILACVTLGVFAHCTGCKKSDEVSGASAPGAQTKVATPQAEAVKINGGSANVSSISPGVDVANRAMASHDFVTATVALLKTDTSSLSPEEGVKKQAAMIKLQRSLADAIAAGDENAKEAAELLRAKARH